MSALLREVLISKLHRATVTEANVDYVGSVTIDRDLIEAVNLWPNELVHVWNVSNGERFQTYVLEGERGSGVVCLNGAAALRVEVGHKVIIAAFGLTDKPVAPKVVLLDERNRIVRHIAEAEHMAMGDYFDGGSDAAAKRMPVLI